jgi:hypothetical protein
MNATNDRAIISSVQKMTGTYNLDQVSLVTANVVSVDEALGTCTVEAISGNAATSIEGVEFQTVVSDGILVIPRVGSEVKVIYSKYTTPLIIQYSEVEKVYLAADLVQMDYDKTNVNCEDFTFNQGDNKGLVKVVSLTTKLNNLENKVNEIISTFNAHFHTSAAAGSPTTPTATPIVGIIIPTQQEDIENTKITH